MMLSGIHFLSSHDRVVLSGIRRFLKLFKQKQEHPVALQHRIPHRAANNDIFDDFCGNLNYYFSVEILAKVIKADIIKTVIALQG